MDQIGKAVCYLRKLCVDIPGRSVGSEGNRRATRYAEGIFHEFGWKTEAPELAVMDWENRGAELGIGNEKFEVFSSPYSLPCNCNAVLRSAGTVKELEEQVFNDTILLLHGDLAKEQLMPKNFVFYNPEEHQRLIARLESCGAKALVCATGRNSALAGGSYPFPLIEDGDFDVPSVYMTEEEGARLLQYTGEKVILRSDCRRIPSMAYNVSAHKGPAVAKRIVITAHIDAKKGTPGAIDNATGVIVLFLLAEMLKDYEGKYALELTAFNGEDYYAVSGQMQYIKAHREKFGDVVLNINIDGAGYHEGGTAFSFFDLPEEIRHAAERVIANFPQFKEGIQWPQGDHSIFVQFGIPAIALTSQWFLDNIQTQDVTHTEKDNPDIVDVRRLPEIAVAIRDLILQL